MIPADAYPRFHRSRDIPWVAQIWTGRYGGAGAWPTEYQRVELFVSRSGPEPPSPNAYVAAFSVGYVAFLYWGISIKDGPVLDIGRSLAEYFMPIWPVGAPTGWPPSGVIGADGLRAAIRDLPIDFA